MPHKRIKKGKHDDNDKHDDPYIGVGICGWAPTVPGTFGLINAVGYPFLTPLASALTLTLRNYKEVTGGAIKVTDTGFKARTKGKYLVGFTAPLIGLTSAEINIFACVNHAPGTQVNTAQVTKLIADSETLDAGAVITFKGSTFLDLKKGDLVELFVSNGNGSPSLQVRLEAWGFMFELVQT